MFKPNPKRQVELKFAELFGRDRKCVVHGARDPEEGRRTPMYRTWVTVGDRRIAEACHRDWRYAYKGLKIELEKFYADGGVVQG